LGWPRPGLPSFFSSIHGGNIATVKAAFAETYATLADLKVSQAPAVQCHLANWFMVGAVVRRARELYGDQEGSHATPSEVAVTQFAYPAAIKDAPLPMPVNTDHAIYGAADFRQRYPDGRMGSNPGLATPEQGQELYQIAVTELSQSYRQFLAAQ
jgi:creatinine amidohydrolase